MYLQESDYNLHVRLGDTDWNHKRNSTKDKSSKRGYSATQNSPQASALMPPL